MKAGLSQTPAKLHGLTENQGVDGSIPPLGTIRINNLRPATRRADANGSLVSLHTYWPYGEETGDPSASDHVMQFTGHERDEMGDPASNADDLDYMHARYYSPWVGRFASIDPAGLSAKSGMPQSWNRYGYGLGNPIRLIDSDGLYPRDFHRDVTELVALAAGLGPGAARAVALAVEAVDTDPSTSPVRNPTEANLDAYHFVSDARLGELMSAAWSSRSLSDVGYFLHAGQDRFSHNDHTSGWNIRGLKIGRAVRWYEYDYGHAFANIFGSSPDDTHTNPGKALSAARFTYKAIAQFNGGNTKVGFSSISAKLGALFSTESETKKAILRQRLCQELGCKEKE